jgi:hypothetical protein
MTVHVTIRYLKGDASAPETAGLTGPFAICHIVNNKGVWVKGFVAALSARDSRPERFYRNRAKVQALTLGQVQRCPYREVDSVFNLIAQDGVGHFRYVHKQALTDALNDVCARAFSEAIVMPRIGTGLGRSKWEEIEPIIHGVFLQHKRTAHILDLP